MKCLTFPNRHLFTHFESQFLSHALNTDTFKDVPSNKMAMASSSSRLSELFLLICNIIRSLPFLPFSISSWTIYYIYSKNLLFSSISNFIPCTASNEKCIHSHLAPSAWPDGREDLFCARISHEQHPLLDHHWLPVFPHGNYAIGLLQNVLYLTHAINMYKGKGCSHRRKMVDMKI